MLKKILIYGIGIFFSKIIVFLLVPIYTRYFSPADYGYYDVLISNLIMLVSISFIEIWSGLIRFIFADDRPYRPVKVFLKLVPILLIFYGLGIMVLNQIMELKFPLLSVLYGLAYLLFAIFNSICRGLNLNFHYVLSGALSTVLSCGLGVWFVLGLHQGISGLLIAQIIGYLCAVIYVEITTKALRMSLRENVYAEDLKAMVLYSIPLMVNSFSFLFLGAYNKNIIFLRLGEVASGYYAFILKFTAILSILISIFSLAWQEVAFQNANSVDRGERYSYYINTFIQFVGLALPIYCLLLYCVAPVIGGKGYISATQYIPLAVFGAFIAEISGVLSVVIAVNKKTLPILLSTVIGAVVNVVLVTSTIKILGINASSIGLCSGFFCAAVYRYFSGKKTVGIRIDIKYVIFLLVQMSLTTICFYIGNILWLICLMVSFIVVWFFVNKPTITLMLHHAKKMVGGQQNIGG